MVSEAMLERAYHEEMERLRRIHTAWQRFTGDFVKPLRPTKSDPKGDDNLLVNLAGPTVRDSVFFLLGTELAFEVDGQSQSDADTWLDACWTANRKMTRLVEAATNGGVTGDTFLRLQPVRAGDKFPRIINLDPSTVSVLLDPHDYENVLVYKIQYNAIDPATGQPVVYRTLIEPDGNQWAITDQESRGNAKTFVTVEETTWPFPWAPIFHAKNLPAPNCFFGMSDLEDDVLRVNHAINFLLSNIARVLRIHGHPKTWGRGFQARDLSIGVDEVIILPGKEGELKNLEMTGDLAGAVEVFEKLKGIYREITARPAIVAGEVENIGQLSGLALQILYGPMVRQINTKRLFFGEMLQEIGMRLLEMGGFGDGHTVEIQWPEILPRDAYQEAQTAVLYDQLGVSKDTLQTRLGFDPETEKEKKAEELQSVADLALQQFDKGTGPDPITGGPSRAGTRTGAGQ